MDMSKERSLLRSVWVSKTKNQKTENTKKGNKILSAVKRRDGQKHQALLLQIATNKGKVTGREAKSLFISPTQQGISQRRT
jgi:hypothetical protein